MRRAINLVTTFTVLAAAVSPMSAQQGRPGAAIAVNPFALLSSDFVAEAEYASSPWLSLGVAANRSTSISGKDGGSGEYNDRRWTSVDVVARRYGGGRALDGLSLGATAGRVWTTRTRTLVFDEIGAGSETFSAAQWTIGLRLDYNRAYRRRLHAGIGLGLKAGLVRTGEDNAEMPYAIPSLRAVVGLRF